MNEIDEQLSRRNVESAGLGDSDVAKLFNLIQALQSRSSSEMQIHINNYLADVTSAGLAFLLCPMKLTSELCVSAIGSSILDPSVYTTTETWPVLGETTDPTTGQTKIFKSSCMHDKLVHIVVTKLFERVGKPFKNFAIVTHHLANVSFYVCLINVETRKLVTDASLVNECGRYCLPLLRNTLYGEEMSDHHRILKEILNAFESSANSFGDDCEVLVEATKKTMEKILSSETSAIFLKEDKYFVTKSHDFGRPLDLNNQLQLQDLKIPIGVGLTGIVGDSGKTIITNNPEKEIVYCNVPSTASRFRNTLGFPFVFKNKVFGVGEVYNRLTGVYTESDKIYARVIGSVFGPLLMQGLKLKRDSDGMTRRDLVTALLSTHKEFDDEEVTRVMESYGKCSLDQFTDMDFQPSTIPENESIAYIIAGLDQLGIVKSLNIHVKCLIRFLIHLRQGQTAFPFRNWFHSFCSFQFLFSLMKNNDFRKLGISDSEAAAMMLATLCNNCDYRGLTHRFQPEGGVVLAGAYSSPGRRQELSAIRQSLTLISDPRNDFLCNMTNDDRHQMLQLIDTMVLNIDIANFMTNLKEYDTILIDETEIAKLDQKSLPDGKDRKSTLVKLIMICAKISDHARAWAHALEIGDRLDKEFRQAESFPGLKSLIVVPNFKNPSTRMTLQSHLITSVCIPAFRILQRFIPSADEYISNLEVNAKKMNAQAKLLKKQENQDQYGDTDSASSIDVSDK